MADPDDRLSRLYRELPREEPSPLLDQAILASARRAVVAPKRNRWAMPVSIAAVLALGIGVSVRMQTEQPGVESSLPSSPAPSSSSEYPLPDTSEPVHAEAAPPSSAQKPAPPAPRRKSEMAREQAPSAKADAESRATQPEPRAIPSAPAQPRGDPEPFAGPKLEALDKDLAVAPPAEKLATAPQTATAPAAAPALRAKRLEAQPQAGVARDSAAPPKDAREIELERIASLRAEGRHEEADKGLEEFRRRHPDYPIPPATWEKVRSR
ncbi:MAG TPA: hypothetical protein VEC19_16180 [Usitatibacter sp.]|nr:hypothetical protein [Usitatibacter sp.]